MSSRPKSLLVITLLLFGGCAAVEEGPLIDRRGWVIRREFISHTKDSSKKVELFWTKPAGDGPYPVLLLIHGYQAQVRNGGESYVKAGRLGMMASRGYVAVSLSQPGYGNSDGPADYCGPFTQDAVLVALDFLRKQPFVRPDKVALYGYSRGAIVAGMVATRDPKLAAVVLGAGVYDFFSWYPTPLRGIDANIIREAGTSADAFKSRSAIHHVEKIKAPVLLLHGAQDERIPVRQAEAFFEKIRASGITAKIKIFSGAGHSIPIDEQYSEAYPFLAEFLR
ncbi:MAG: S9 family peptidase [Deltaproteobacteria bacterium]|nr:S9 family peptidase [Deltaproteobacteria bacterium]